MGTETKQETCEQRLPLHLAGRLETLSRLVKGVEVSDESDLEALTDEELIEIVGSYGAGVSRKKAEDMGPALLRERAQDHLYELALSVETRKIIDVCISTGGPEDRFEFWLDEDGQPDRVWYVFKDWFDGARRELEGEERDTAIRTAELAGWIEDR